MTGSRSDAKLLGILAGILSCVSWFVLVFFLESVFNTVPHTLMNFHNAITAWIYMGPIPLFIGGGQVIFLRTFWSDPVKREQVAALKATIAAIFLWTGTILFLRNMESSGYIYQVMGGYLLMLALIPFFLGNDHIIPGLNVRPGIIPRDLCDTKNVLGNPPHVPVTLSGKKVHT